MSCAGSVRMSDSGMLLDCQQSLSRACCPIVSRQLAGDACITRRSIVVSSILIWEARRSCPSVSRAYRCCTENRPCMYTLHCGRTAGARRAVSSPVLSGFGASIQPDRCIPAVGFGLCRFCWQCNGRAVEQVIGFRDQLSDCCTVLRSQCT